jgi:hypothetical protein
MTELTEEVIEAFLLGDTHDAWEQDEALVSLASDVFMGATGPAPKPSPALRAFLGEPDSVSAPAPEMVRPLAAVPPRWHDTAVPGHRPPPAVRNVVPFFRRLRLTVGIAAAAGVAAAALAVTATTGVLPKPVLQAVSWVVEAVTPFELGDPAPTVTGGDQGPPATGPGGLSGTGAEPGPTGPGGASGQLPATTPGPGRGAPGQPPATAPAPASGTPGEPGSLRPVTPPASIPAGVPAPAEPPAAVDQGGRRPPAPSVAVIPGPSGETAPPAGGGSATPSTTSVERARQAPDGGTVASTVPGPPNRR